MMSRPARRRKNRNCQAFEGAASQPPRAVMHGFLNCFVAAALVATDDVVDQTEEGGCLVCAEREQVRHRGIQSGKPQCGTVGSGNHFLELQVVAEITDHRAAEAFELFEPEATSQMGGVAKLEMSIQREGVGNERDPVFDQDANPLFE